MSASKFAALLLAGALLAAPAMAQDFKILPGGKVPAPFDPLVDELKIEQVKALLSRLDAQVEAGFKGHPDLKARMEKDLASIPEMKPGPERDEGVAKYQGTYGAEYRDVLKEGGVDLNQYASEVEKIVNDRSSGSIAPPFALTATVKDDLFIVVQGSSNEEYATVEQGLDVEILSFQDSTERKCAVLGFGATYFQPNWIMAETTSAIGGACEVRGSRTATIEHSGARPTTIAMSGETRASGTAGGILGSAVCSSSSGATIDGAIVSGAMIMVFAPGLFIASAEDQKAFSFRTVLPAGTPRTATVNFHTFGSSFAALPISVAGCRGTVERTRLRVTN